MKEQETGSWSEFLEVISALRTQAAGTNSYLLFRGQADSRWLLQTTWERDGYRNVSFLDYVGQVSVIKDEVEILTGKRWSLDWKFWEDLFSNENMITKFFDAPFDGFDYLSYLRQHGFPSPLMDWTRSVYIAAYFAFQRVDPLSPTVAVYVLDSRGVFVRSTAYPTILRFGARNGGHRRHFMQQGEYTVCLNWEYDSENGGSDWRMASHDKAIASGETLQDQRKIFKFTIPATERLRVLEQLDEQNINAFTLFGTEDGLMQTLANRDFRRFLR